MESEQHKHRVCDASVSRAFEVLGKRWNGMIIDSLSTGPLSFVELRRSVGGISDAVLSDRLTELTGERLISRHVDPGPPVSVTYALTESGRQLIPVLADLGRWASLNLRTEDTQP